MADQAPPESDSKRTVDDGSGVCRACGVRGPRSRSGSNTSSSSVIAETRDVSAHDGRRRNASRSTISRSSAVGGAVSEMIATARPNTAPKLRPDTNNRIIS